MACYQVIYIVFADEYSFCVTLLFWPPIIFKRKGNSLCNREFSVQSLVCWRHDDVGRLKEQWKNTSSHVWAKYLYIPTILQTMQTLGISPIFYIMLTFLGLPVIRDDNECPHRTAEVTVEPESEIIEWVKLLNGWNYWMACLFLSPKTYRTYLSCSWQMYLWKNLSHQTCPRTENRLETGMG